MNKKLNYEAPEMEVVKVRMEGGIMNYSGGQGVTNSPTMVEDNSTFDSWD